MFKDNESQKVGELRATIRIQEKEIDELKVDKSHREREKTLSMKEARLEMKTEAFEQQKELRLEKLEAEKDSQIHVAKVELLQKQVDTAPYALLNDLLKALLVKFPTIDLKGISVKCSKKD